MSRVANWPCDSEHETAYGPKVDDRLQLALGIHDHIRADCVCVRCSVGLEVVYMLEDFALATPFAQHVPRSEHYELPRAPQWRVGHHGQSCCMVPTTKCQRVPSHRCG
jgi:hypothetical protein